MEKTRLVDRFELDPNASMLGEGGMGAVYLGQDTLTGELAAIKLLRAGAVNTEMVKRFHLEGEALRKLNHPNIVKMLAAEEVAGKHYLVMEYVSGGSLRQLLELNQRLSIQRILYIALDLADALTRAHRLDILHRDIKPENVLIAEDGTPKLTDFGVARVGDVHLTQDGALVGTMAYLSPESFNNEPLDERHDIWAFGVLLYEMLTCERPFPQESVTALIRAITTAPVPDLEAIRPDAPVALIDLIYRMLEKEPNARIRSVRMVGAEIEAIIQGGTTSIQRIRPETAQVRFATTPMPAVVHIPMPVVRNLPAQATPFVGREAEVQAISEQLSSNQTRLVTILGPGGTGKTRVAMATAEALVGSYLDGVTFVPLESVSGPQHIVTAVADAVEFPFSGATDPESELLNFLREKQMLLVLDNFEHLTDGATFITRVLSTASGLHLIVTSRERLRLRGEAVFELDGMRVPDRLDSVEALEAYPSVQLFLASAHRVQPEFELDAETASHVAKTIRLVQGMPLAIELAAGWLELLPVDEVATEIEKSLDFLETDLRDMPERHRSLRAVFDYSWDLLTEEERKTFIQLSVFRGGFEREAAQRVSGAGLRTLGALVNKSLLRRDPNGRYAVHKLLQQYAEEEFAVTINDPDAVWRAHADYYGSFMARMADNFDSRSERKAIQSIDIEIENIRAAWRWSVETLHVDALEQLTHGLLSFYISQSMLSEGVRRFRGLAERLEAAGHRDTRLYWRARLREGWLVGRLGDYDRIRSLSLVSYDYFKERDSLEAAHALTNVAYGCMMQGDYDDARKYADLAIEAARKAGHIPTLITAQANLGYVEYLDGHFERAKTLYEDILAQDVDTSPISRAYGFNNLGEVVVALGDLERAAELFQEAYEIFKSYGHRRGMGFTINNIAGVHSNSGAFDKSVRMYAQAYELYREIGDRAGIGHSLSAMAYGSFYEADYARALRCYQDTLTIRRELGDQAGVGRTLSEIALTLIALEQLDDAQPYIDEALKIGESLNQNIVWAQALAAQGAIHLYEGDYDAAMPYFQHALWLSDQHSRHMVSMYALAGIAAVLCARGDHVRGLEILGFVEHTEAPLRVISGPLVRRIKERVKQTITLATYETATKAGQGHILADLVQSYGIEPK